MDAATVIDHGATGTSVPATGSAGPVGAADGPINGRFASRKKALDWLWSKGHKVSMGKFYQDCKAGFPHVAMDGSVLERQIMSYAGLLGPFSSGASGGGRAALHDPAAIEDDARKARAEADMAEMKAERMRREEDRYWLHADDAWAVTAALVGSLRGAIRHHLHVRQRDIVLSCGGDQDRSAEVYELLEEIVSSACNDVASSGLDNAFAKE